MRRALFLSVLLGIACVKKGDSESVAVDAKLFKSNITEKVTMNGLILEEVDVNNDGRPDIFNHYRERANAPRLLVRKETDVNMDGQVDTRTHYNDQGLVQTEELDLDFDGTFDQRNFYQDTNSDGLPERVTSETDTDFDGKPNVFVTFRDGVAVRKERDTNGDGRIDMWEKFDEQGNVIKAGRDTEFDGTVDQRWD